MGAELNAKSVTCKRCGFEAQTQVVDPGRIKRQCKRGGMCEFEFDDGVEFLACVYRGKKVGERECELCGQKGRLVDVFQCALFGECTLRKWKVGSQLERICLLCEERKHC